MILHIDMDAFYASVEQRDNSQLREKCVIVGGTSNRGVVSAASYEARKYGVHSAMPIFQAKRKCPHGIYIRPRMGRYKEVSRAIMTTLREFSPLVEQISIDEAFLDVSGCEALYGTVVEIAETIKKKIKDVVGLTCSIGMAPNKFLAKVASDMNKPDGLTVIMPEETEAFIKTLSVHKVPGVGKKTEADLESLGIFTLGDVQKYSEEDICGKLGKFGRRLWALAAGEDDRPVVPESSHKSVSSECTLRKDTNEKALLKKHLIFQSEEVAAELRKLQVRARTITLKLKNSDFKQITRSVTLPNPTQSSETIYREVAGLLEAHELKKKVRLVGVGASGLLPDASPVQMDLFASKSGKDLNWEKVDKTLDTIKKKFGKDSVRRAALTEEEDE
jgi:DNA polymerase IV